MKDDMFCDQCQETFRNTGCVKVGCCGKTAHTGCLMDQLIAKLETIALAIEKNGAVTREYNRFICRAMFATITNTNFNDSRLESLIAEADMAVKALEAPFTPPVPGVLAWSDPDIRSLKELILYGIKGICAYAFHALALGHEDVSVYNFTIKALAALAKDLPADKLKSMVLECGTIAAISMAMLDEANTSVYGHPVIGKASTVPCGRPGILVSGHDLKDLEELLIQTENTGIDVYTHGEMLPANYYPGLRKYAHLRGNYGGAWWSQNRDFETFRGVILMTSNCIVTPTPAYKNRIFTTGMVGYPDVPHIPHRHAGCRKDFSKLVELAKTLPPPLPSEAFPDTPELIGGFAHQQVARVIKQVAQLVKDGQIKRFVVMAGCDGRRSRAYFTEVARKLPHDTVILTAGCAKYRYIGLKLGEIQGIPRVLDAGQCNDSYSLVRIALVLKEELKLKSLADLPISFDLAWYEQKAVAVLLALLALGFKNIRLGPTLPAFLSPNVTALLVREFGIRQTSDAETDIADMMAEK